ncbi:MAG: UvrD-helicase domain-containing protein [Candidatus Omnitrophica bacterium]|nr:UvrD-helicase domain-containing protein [Candidatus Omnitrophota bacterium]
MENKFPFVVSIKEASAGTGKTFSIMQKISNLKNFYGSYEFLKKILGITFSESAAIELKERLITLINKELKFMSEEERIKIQNILLNLNFSTIHSFTRKLLKRFSVIIDIDPFFQIIDENQSEILFLNALNKVISESENLKFFFEILKDLKLNNFTKIIFAMKRLHPYIFLGKPLTDNSLTEKIVKFYKSVEETYLNLKKELGYLDFDDLEKLTFITLIKRPEAMLILEDFDENIDFIFVDEFQDTNLLQWEIIKKLTEEWSSGYGAKAEERKFYGIYIVGDKKQSIYKFRGGEKEVFEEAKKAFSDFYTIEKLKKNYRSTSEIINFINEYFKDEADWKDEELIFGGEMEDLPSKIEIKFFENKNDEYDWVCSKIISLLNKNILVKDKKTNTKRKIEFRDILLLIRKRTKNFKLLEEKLKTYNIPYVIIGGIGFYQELEIKFLLSLLYSLIDPTDKYSVWNLKNSIFKINEEKIENWRNLLDKYEISFLIEEILKEIDFWKNLNIQQKANVEKFLSILQEQSYLPLYQITKNFRELSLSSLEPKADIYSLHQNAVKIMTIHKSKGLEFPAVFILNIEDLHYSFQKEDFFFYKKEEGEYKYVYKEESDEEFKKGFINQMSEEENRILYVAMTRAMQFLFISGTKFNHPISKKFYELSEKFHGTVEEIKPLLYEKKSEEVKIEPVFQYTPFLSYTKEKREEGFVYSEAIIGDITHRILNEISEGKLEFKEDEISKRIDFYLLKQTKKAKNYREKILKIFKLIRKNKKIEEIVKSKISENVKSEFPFICEIDGSLYEGKIDKIFVKDNKIEIYDFKTFLGPLENYKFQLKIYKEAVKRIFKKENIECYIVDLSKGEILKIDI